MAFGAVEGLEQVAEEILVTRARLILFLMEGDSNFL